ncbi:alpha-1,3-glucan synthase Ags3 [Aspergillus clavatus NRRL 1]|uniref:alpha-1,3-glucan synthase n=1 Tax=Aspergillus clavatus (strain ATCC 1007 / CBS 513.65 / DSM 816 / NCTC 3887 / NRRL 1 / QM 1276 / 107) TaxID=344612 RepID=A1CLJ7_ASPCL|nr:alpha-1,3-glucan synthase Ags3 [Aspergillus clavatus NRRL 1]EAW10021.1 alpha-1,3-glucan synthase Ags3 [Aspergillus clavatus NRRL 1]
MQRLATLLLSLLLSVHQVLCWPYTESLVDYNLNENKSAESPIDYWGEWPDHKYHPSPKNWRFPVYTIFLDRIANGDPTNDDINGTAFEHVVNSNQMRHGGDLVGLIDSLDYIRGMGFKGIYFAGTGLMNLPWAYDGYSPVDTTLLDMHHGTLQDWRRTISEIHDRDMYVILDNTLATLSNLIGFQGHLNDSADFRPDEYHVEWISDRRYADFHFSNEYNESCAYPKFWYETGFPLGSGGVEKLHGCYNSDFDQYGELEAFGNFPDWQRQLTKFASVQDRLREWHKPVRDIITKHYCIQIASLDIDGFRYDKAAQATLEPLGEISAAFRECATKLGKDNFFISGEITSGDTFGSLYLGRGRQPNQRLNSTIDALKLNNNSAPQYFLREDGHQALDSAAFHYTIYRSMTRFLGMDGNLVAGFDLNTDFIQAWNEMLVNNDFLNHFTNEVDPRHMYGVSNQDNFRWPAIKNGTAKYLLGLFIVTLELPGIPLILWGEEQDMYVFDATATNYLFGRQPMTYQTAWWTHGCFNLNTTKFYDFPNERGLYGCHDITVTYDQRNPAHPLRNIMKRMFEIREQYPVANDGIYLQTLSQLTKDIYLPGSSTTPTVTGLWSVLRSYFPGIQKEADSKDNSTFWLVYHNDNRTVSYGGDCKKKDTALLAPYKAGTKLTNLFYPYDELTLQEGPGPIGGPGSESYGCTSNLTLQAWEYRAYVRTEEFVEPGPTVTEFAPGHDARLLSSEDTGETVDIRLGYSKEMSCDGVTRAISLNSTSQKGITPTLDTSSVNCTKITPRTSGNGYAGEIPTVWTWSAKLKNVHHGVHEIIVKNVTTTSGLSTNAVDRFLLRMGSLTNPLMTPLANYSSSLVHKSQDGSIYIQHDAAGADQFRYSTTFGRTWSDWTAYEGGNTTIDVAPWSGTDAQHWKGTHVRVQYFSRLTGSSDYIQEGDEGWEDDVPRRFPQLWWNGPYNQYGYDAGLESSMRYDSKERVWKYDFVYEWPSVGQISVWGVGPDGIPDPTEVYGDVANSSVVQKLPPSYLSSNVINITTLPPFPHLGWTISLNDANLRYVMTPVGSGWAQLVLFVLLWVVPILMGLFGAFIFMRKFYRVKLNRDGAAAKEVKLPMIWRKIRGHFANKDEAEIDLPDKGIIANATIAGAPEQRRTVLIATMEYNIEDWNVKVKIGGLGVMAQLMAQNLKHQNLIWAVPCVGDIEYPEDTPAEPMVVTILDKPYLVNVQYHVVDNITYVILDAPVFRQQTKAEPYPPRMDDLDSAIYYSAWNQCIAETIKRFPSIDLYHINDFHGCLAPLYLLPTRTIPVCLSLHNAEFQGLWPLRTQQEKKEVCSVFNLPVETATKYCQFGNVFNLLHTGASYLRFHQHSFGAVGVSKKYGKRSWARYPIFWSLDKIGSLPNPDPSDTGAVGHGTDATVPIPSPQERINDKLKAQKWAGLKEDADANLLVFVGRWSKQKGVDLIADVIPAILSSRPEVQLICVGPIIDLYGKLAAVKLEKIMAMFPGRVFSKPEFTILPPYVFSGADFALIPSRDEPFGLIAVEFGRKGALGIGSRIGGLGQMPGWWYTVESDATRHLLHQLRTAIKSALDSDLETREEMRTNSAQQRFPVLEWIQKLETLQRTAIKIHHEKNKDTASGPMPDSQIYWETQNMRDSTVSLPGLPPSLRDGTDSPPARLSLNAQSRLRELQADDQNSGRLGRKLSLGRRAGPGQGRSRLMKKSLRSSQVAEGQTDDETTDADLDEDDLDARLVNYISSEEAMRAVGHDLGSPDIRDSYRSENLGTPSQSMSTSPYYVSRAPSPAPRAPSELFQHPFQLALHSGASTPSIHSRNVSVLSLPSVKGDHNQQVFELNKVDPTFTDSMGHFTRRFEEILEGLDKKNSMTDCCIETFLMKSERKFFNMYNDAQLKKHRAKNAVYPSGAADYVEDETSYNRLSDPGAGTDISDSDEIDRWLSRLGYMRPMAIQRFMRRRVGNWPVYALFLGLGQIIATNSAQITLLVGQVGESATKLYVIAAIYCVASIVWWLMYSRLPAVIVLSVPWFIYGFAFIIIGVSPYGASVASRGWAQNVAAAVYAVASSSGSLFFALNFGDQGSVPVKDWMFRAGLIQGISQLYTVALWYWSSRVTTVEIGGVSSLTLGTWRLTAVVMPIAAVCFVIGVLLALGLPNYYRQAPSRILFFYTSLFRRRIVLWFFFMVIVQNWFLAAAFGRNWSFLWSSNHAKTWQIVVLIICFFLVLWVIILSAFRILSKEHSWILPVFGLSLGAPRWAQTWWGTSNIGYYLPWAGSLTSGAVVSRSLWLWLGVLDEVQQVGLGMILLQTLTRVHVCFVLLAAQAVGSIATICARGFAPNRLGPDGVSPNVGTSVDKVGNAWFWISLFFQLLASFGFLLFYRKEQLNRP